MSQPHFQGSGNILIRGNIEDSQAVAIGKGARATINQYTEIIIQSDNFEDQPPVPGEPPYKGLAYFTEADKNIFFGREKLSDQLTNRLQTTYFLTLIGASGSGKSSLLRAGIIPRLRQNNWRIHIIKPGAHPLTNLAHTLTPDAKNPSVIKKMYSLLQNEPETLDFAATKLVTQTNAERLLLAVDQFEELFTQCKDPQERTAFINNLIHTAQGQGSTTILLSMRADFYDRVSEFPILIDLISQKQVYVKPMGQEDLVRVIAEPAKRGGWQFVERLVELIVRDVDREPGRLPLLSHALLETWERRRGTVMTLGGYEDAGGVQGAIAKTAQETLHRLIDQNPRFETVAREVFLNLTELGEGAEDTRRVVTIDELTAGIEKDTLKTVLETLIRARLITTGKEGRIEVAHEALIRRWPTLKIWLTHHRERMRFERQLKRDAQQWKALGKDSGALYRGARLQQAIEWSGQHEWRVIGLIANFLTISRAEAERDEREREMQRQRELKMAHSLTETQAQAAQRLRWVVWALGGIVVAMLIIVGIFVTPLIQERWAIWGASSAMAHIPAGEFVFGSSDPSAILIGTTPSYLWAQQDILLPEFWIDKFEVSNRQYSLCANYSDQCEMTLENFEQVTDPLKQTQAVVNVTIREANAYCRWLGKRLPTEAEWERAARGMDHQWPWGDDPPSAQLVNSPLDMTPNEDGIIEDVTGRPEGASVEGVHHLIGNVWEWTSSYSAEPSDTQAIFDTQRYWDGLDITYDSKQRFILRGGGWRFGISHVSGNFPTLGKDQDGETGFRCAADTPP